MWYLPWRVIIVLHDRNVCYPNERGITIQYSWLVMEIVFINDVYNFACSCTCDLCKTYSSPPWHICNHTLHRVYIISRLLIILPLPFPLSHSLSTFPSLTLSPLSPLSLSLYFPLSHSLSTFPSLTLSPLLLLPCTQYHQPMKGGGILQLVLISYEFTYDDRT